MNANRLPTPCYGTNFEMSKCLFLVGIITKWQLCDFKASQRELGVLFFISWGKYKDTNGFFTENFIFNLTLNFTLNVVSIYVPDDCFRLFAEVYLRRWEISKIEFLGKKLRDFNHLLTKKFHCRYLIGS